MSAHHLKPSKARWSDRTLAELRSRLLNDFFDGQVLVAAGVEGGRILGVEVMQYESEDEHYSHGTMISYKNPEHGPSLPSILYKLPRDWRPVSIRFVVSFFDEPPASAWALVADTALDVGFGHARTPLDIPDETTRCVITSPRPDQFHGVG